MKEHGLLPGFISMSVGTKVPVKKWGDRNWEEFVGGLYRCNRDLTLVAVSAPDDREKTESILHFWGGVKANLCGKSSPRVSGLVLKASKIFIGHDSGPMHLAGAVGTPVVAIFSARNLPGQWYPHGEANSVLYNRTPCFGCGLDVCVDYETRCIRSIKVSEVLDNVKKYLG